MCMALHDVVIVCDTAALSVMALSSWRACAMCVGIQLIIFIIL